MRGQGFWVFRFLLSFSQQFLFQGGRVGTFPMTAPQGLVSMQAMSTFMTWEERRRQDEAQSLLAFTRVSQFERTAFAARSQSLSLPARRRRLMSTWSAPWKQRRTTREYTTAKLSLETCRPFCGRRTGEPPGRETHGAVCVWASSTFDIYVVTDTGADLYDAPNQKLKPVTGLNVKDSCGTGHVPKPPNILVLVRT